jgi:hypothetical protein
MRLVGTEQSQKARSPPAQLLTFQCDCGQIIATINARAARTPAASKAEHDERLRIATEILQVLRDGGWNAELASDAAEGTEP